MCLNVLFLTPQFNDEDEDDDGGGDEDEGNAPSPVFFDDATEDPEHEKPDSSISQSSRRCVSAPHAGHSLH